MAIWVAVGAVVLALVGVSGWWVLGGSDALHQRTVADLIGSDPSLHPVEATDDLCRDLGCVEGWRTDYGSYLRFESEGQAEHWAVILGDQGRRWKTIVLDMHQVNLSFEQRRYAIDTLFHAHSW
jgi:hypothetical protein